MASIIIIPKSLVGMTEAEATKMAKDAGYACRVLRRDKMVVITVTQELRADRVNLEVDINRVTKAWIG
jgi:hypothetical protein